MVSITTDTGYLMAEGAMRSASAKRMESMERLSTGTQINSAADDAAGVAIASRLQVNITAMRKAMDNAGDAQGLLSTAEGGMVEIENILQRMRELMVQAGNDTLNSGDREKVGVELDQLTQEVDRIAATTTWAGETLFNGQNGAKKLPTLATSTDDVNSLTFMIGGGTSQYDTIGFDLKALTAGALNIKGAPAAPTMTATVTDAAASANGIVASVNSSSTTAGTVKITSGFNDGDQYSMKINGNVYAITADGSADGYDDTNIGLMQQMVDKINSTHTGKGVTATYDSTNAEIDITYSYPIVSDLVDAQASPTLTASGTNDLVIAQSDNTKSGSIKINGTSVTLAAAAAPYADTTAGWTAQTAAAIQAAVGGVSINTDTAGAVTISSNLTFSDVTTTATATTPTMDISGSKITVGGTPSTGDVFSLKIDGKDVSITVADDGYADTVAGVTHQMIKAIEDLKVSGMTVINTASTTASTVNTLAVVGSDASMSNSDSLGAGITQSGGVISLRPATDTSASGEKYTLKIDNKVDVSFDVFGDKGSYDTTTATGIAQAMKDKINGAGIAGVTAKTSTVAATISSVSETGTDVGLTISASGGILSVTGATDSSGAGETLNFTIGGNALVFDIDTHSGSYDQTSTSELATSLAEFINSKKIAGISATAANGDITVQKTTIAVTTASNADDGVFTVTKGGALDVTSNAAARRSLDSVEAALTVITDARAGLGAVINRLDNAISNLTSVTVNTELSLSRIKDTDYAQEMSRMTTAQILEKATMAMMSQSNASKQDVLQLLQ
jgi:flagellin